MGRALRSIQFARKLWPHRADSNPAPMMCRAALLTTSNDSIARITTNRRLTFAEAGKKPLLSNRVSRPDWLQKNRSQVTSRPMAGCGRASFDQLAAQRHDAEVQRDQVLSPRLSSKANCGPINMSETSTRRTNASFFVSLPRHQPERHPAQRRRAGTQ